MAQQPYPDETPQIGWWDSVFTPEVRQRYERAGSVYPDNDRAFRWASRTAYDIAAGMTKEASLAKHLKELEDELGLTPQPTPGQPTRRPLIGPLRIQDKMFRDDSGWRRVLFCSWFPALRILRDSPAEFYRQLDAIAAAGYQGIRIFLAVGGWTPYWDGREVAPISFVKAEFDGNHLRPKFTGLVIGAWPNYDDLLRELLRACRARALRLHVTTGDMQIIDPDGTKEAALHQRLARLCAEEGGSDVIALMEVTNEFPLNRYGGDAPASIEAMGRVIQTWKAMIPNLLCAQGAIPQNEEPDALTKASTYGEVCVSHTTRDPFEMCLKRTFGLVYWEGNYRGFPKPFKQGEPAGPGADSYARLDDPASLVALYAMHALTGQDSNFFQGAAVRYHQPLESEWGFKELPALLENLLPEDIAQWEHGSNRHGGIEYWWKGDQFRTATHANWDTSPPRPVATWTLYTGTAVQSGTGTPPRVTGLLAGTWV